MSELQNILLKEKVYRRDCDIEGYQRQQDEIIVALGSMGILPSEIVAEIERLTKELDHALSDTACYRDEGYKLTAEIERLQARNEVLCALLVIAQCPDLDCDGRGTVCKGKYQNEDGSVECDLHQCQWCDERHDAIAAAQEDKT